MSEKLPLVYNYDAQTRALDVEYGDGQIVRYFEIDPRLAFLSFANERRNRDFLVYLETRLREGNPVKSEVIKEADATKPIGEPQTRSVVGQQQNRHTIPTWGHKKPAGNDGAT